MLSPKEVRSPARKIGDVLVRSLKACESAQLRAIIRKHYVTLRLMTEEQAWVGKRLRARSSQLCPPRLGVNGLSALVREMARCAERNTYLSHFLAAAAGRQFPRLMAKVQAEGHWVFPEVIALAFVMDRLTDAMHKDWKVLEECHGIWTRGRQEPSTKQPLTWFERAKIASVETCVKRVVGFHKEGVVDPRYLQIMLPLNIAEAMLEDLRHNNCDNAHVAWLLASHNREATRRGSDGRSAYWSPDQKAVLYAMPQLKSWVDLYQTWNMAFVTNYGHYPYFLTKLVVPGLANYHDHPEEYLYHRLTTLYTYIHFEYFQRVEQLQRGGACIDWGDQQLARLWGACNRHSAEKYLKITAK
jgi:hypothetical protein